MWPYSLRLLTQSQEPNLSAGLPPRLRRRPRPTGMSFVMGTLNFPFTFLNLP
jgi:hypothetical protein